MYSGNRVRGAEVSAVTCWYLWNFRDRRLEFNHISDGYSRSVKAPTPMCEHQKAVWAGRAWDPREGRLIDGVVTEVPQNEGTK